MARRSSQSGRTGSPAEDILEQVEGLEAQLEELKQRSGMSDDPLTYPERGQGGPVLRPLNAAELLSNAESHVSRLTTDLSDRVQPALENVLEQEKAIPQGVPLKVPTHITSHFGKRQNPFGFGKEFHNGLDFAGDPGDPVITTAAGTVTHAGWGAAMANMSKSITATATSPSMLTSPKFP